ncbi:pantoate--beta-alanine ligase [Methylophaga sp. OBS3]|uniref:pantoate--beta-alanine ligase n=1 Tax=Methylophaga sp. OBS3 TaxID=2991934 RepID=UPI0022515331|nr:pantoate--beta-alanine ligase [Methylophaga sp. OBS3]MCX4189490.1 pantoate--beta-alanine ligase [Methylophaga sp. OBS3]
MQIEESLKGLRAQLKIWREQNLTIGFVPTMGNLHDGHLSLLKQAAAFADKVVVSIFVNPMQFDDPNDLEKYPRTLANDIQLLSDSGCDLLFQPDSTVMYPAGLDFHSFVHVPGMDDKLCGLERPGHFDGVATVVTKLFNMVQPDIAVFGEKDYQQLLLIHKLVQDFNLPVKIIAGTTHREADGLAMSSRNNRLTSEHRQIAPKLYEQLNLLKAKLKAGEKTIQADIETAISTLTDYGFSVDYLEVRRADNLMPFDSDFNEDLRILVAARLGEVRLIDNVAVGLSTSR